MASEAFAFFFFLASFFISQKISLHSSRSRFTGDMLQRGSCLPFLLDIILLNFGLLFFQHNNNSLSTDFFGLFTRGTFSYRYFFREDKKYRVSGKGFCQLIGFSFQSSFFFIFLVFCALKFWARI
jgi:hypothetical protein